MNSIKKDIFARIMEFPGLSILNLFYKRNKEILLYCFFGGLAFLVSVGTFGIFSVILRVNELIANILSWIITVLFAFFTNRIWVFKSPTNTKIEFLAQVRKFFMGRVITLIIEEAILLIFISWLQFSSIYVKIGAQIVVIVFNYIISKLIVFK